MKEASAFILMTVLQNVLTQIPAPFNLTVSCRNFETVAYWNYSESSLRPLFKVKILKDVNNGNSEMIDTWLHYQNISSSVMNIYDTYYVNVTAVKGSEWSKSADSLQFSYCKYLSAEVHCTLDFPAVKLSVKSGQGTVTFTHPFQVYKNMAYLENFPNGTNVHNDCKTFKFKVLLNGKIVKSDECNEEICKATFPVLENNEMCCVSIAGEMCETYMTDSQEICQREEPQTSWTYSYLILVIVCVVVLASLLAVIGMIVFLRKTKTMPPLPSVLVPSKFKMQPEQVVCFGQVPSKFKMQPEQNMIPKDYGKVQDVQIVWPLVVTPKELPVDSAVGIAACLEDSRFAIGPGHVGEWSGSQESTQLLDLSKLSHSDCGDRPGHCEPQADRMSSGYDRPHLLEEEISPGYGHM